MEKYDTIRDAAQAWVREFDAIPMGVVEKLIQSGDEIEEITPWTEEELEDDSYREWLPVWGTMWHFDDPVDEWWLEEKDGLQKMKECGFRVYTQEDYGYIFGIDGAGYDFYEEHWIPLYLARGLHWHKEENKENDQ